MADVRALLRSERASRRITHPHASYSSSGQLSCSLCHLNVKSETLWDSHVRSAGHVNALKQAQKAQVESNQRKRKAAEEETHHSRKKSRSGIEGDREVSEDEQEDGIDETEVETATSVLEGFVREQEPEKPAVPLKNVDEDEWAAFERDIATVPTDEPVTRAGVSAGAVITAQPISAEELRAQSQTEEANRSKQRQMELEAEKEDATRALEDEFEEMEALEQRVRKLREQREALRSGKGLSEGPKEQPASVAVDMAQQQTPTEPTLAGDFDDDDEDDEEDEWNLWKR